MGRNQIGLMGIKNIGSYGDVSCKRWVLYGLSSKTAKNKYGNA